MSVQDNPVNSAQPKTSRCIKSLINQAPWKTAQLTHAVNGVPDNPLSDLGSPSEMMQSDPEMEATRHAKESWIEVPLNPGDYELLFGDEPSELAAEFGKKLHEVKLELHLPSLEVGFADDRKIAFKFEDPFKANPKHPDRSEFTRVLDSTLEQVLNDVLTPKEIEKPMLFAAAPWKNLS